MGEPYRCPVRVRYGECDAQGVVFNAHYLAYCDLALTELWRAAVGSYQAMVDRGVDIVVAEAHLRFRSPARFDDELTLEIAIGELGTTNLPSRHRILRGEELLVEVAMRHVMVETATFAKTPIPDWLRDALARYSVELS